MKILWLLNPVLLLLLLLLRTICDRTHTYKDEFRYEENDEAGDEEAQGG